MNAKTIIGAALVGLCWAGAGAHAQPVVAPALETSPATVHEVPVASPYQAVPAAVLPPGPVPHGALPPGPAGPPTGLSDWITYRRPQCCSYGPVTPLFSELFLRVGPSFVLGGNYPARELQTGWTIEGGARGLLFNTAQTKAWVVEAHLVNSNNSGGGGVREPVILNIFVPNEFGVSEREDVAVTVRNFNRTMVGIGTGWEWYPWLPANAPEGKWRVGADVGGRYGSASMWFNEIRHRTDVVGGVWAAAHSDYEIPCRCCYLSFGTRLEWAYTWSDILQRATDVQELNFLVNFAVRY